MDRWLSGLEQAVALGGTQQSYEAENKDLLECLRDFARTTQREEDSGAIYNQKQSQKDGNVKAGPASGDLATDFANMSSKDQKKFLTKVTGMPKAQVTAFIAKAKDGSGGQSGKSSGGATASVPSNDTSGPDEITFEGTKYFRAPAPLKYKYVNKKVSAPFDRPVAHTEKYVTLNQQDSSNKYPMLAVPYAATVDEDPTAPEKLRTKKCDSCGMWGHTKGRCLQKRN
jgi:hypothetical protein